ncbi:unnamed protein product [Oreochromis niloticus]|nr:unnamed protein product [Mustela putorius furo]
MINFYNRFLPRAAHLLQPLYAALTGKTAKDPVDWLPERIHAFSAAKSALADAALLAHPLPSAEIALTTDASDVAVGGVLEQRVSGLWQPLAFFSRTLRDAERKYSVFDRELLALHLATRHFRFFLEGRNFTAYVDHKPLTFAMSKVSDPWSARQQRQLAAISEFTTDIQHVAGKSNHVADCLSRVLVSPVYVGVDYAAMAAEQHADPDILALQSMKTGLVLEDTPVWDGGPRLLCDVSTGRPRPVVPLSWRRRVFDSVHALSHPSVRASVKLVSARFVWPGLRKTVKEWAAVCVPCQRSKIHRHTQAPLEPFRIPGRRFDHVHVDLVGPLPQSQGFTHLLTVVDRTTRWPEVVPLASTTAATVARAFLSTWVSRFGPPADITSDRGPQFVSELWSAMADGLGVKVHRTTAYHPQANGMCERFHRSLKAALRASLTGGDWVDRLPWVLLGLRSAVKEDLGVSPAELVLGQPLRVPGEFLPESPPPCFDPSLLPFRPPKGSFPVPGPVHHCLPDTFVPSSLDSARFVFVRHDAHRTPLRPPYDGPYRVLKPGNKHFILDFGGRQEVVSVDRLKPAHVMQEDQVVPAQAPRRGRPPATGLLDSVFSPRSDPQSPESKSSAAFSDRQCQPRFRAGLPSVTEPFELIGMDLVGKLTLTDGGNQYICVMVDYFTKWAEAYPLKNKTANEVTSCILDFFYKFGAPKRLLTDQGSEFCNKVNYGLCKTLGIQRSLCSPYHPQTNGLVERLNGTIQRSLKLVSDEPKNWDKFLQSAMFGLRTKKQLTTKYSPYFLMFGREARYPSEIAKEYKEVVYAEVTKNVKTTQDKICRGKAKRGEEDGFQVGDLVLRKNVRQEQRKGGKLDADMLGPLKIVKLDGKSADLMSEKGKRPLKVNIDQLTHYFQPEERVPAELKKMFASCEGPSRKR